MLSILVSLAVVFWANASNVTDTDGRTDIYVMHFSQAKHATLMMNRVSEFAAEICNNRSEILPGYKLRVNNSMMEHAVSTACTSLPTLDVMHICLNEF